MLTQIHVPSSSYSSFFGTFFFQQRSIIRPFRLAIHPDLSILFPLWLHSDLMLAKARCSPIWDKPLALLQWIFGSFPSKQASEQGRLYLHSFSDRRTLCCFDHKRPCRMFCRCTFGLDRIWFHKCRFLQCCLGLCNHIVHILH